MSRTVEAVLRLSAKLGSMAAFAALGQQLNAVDRKAKALNRSQGMLAAGASRLGGAVATYLAPAALAYGAQRAVRDYAALERQINRIGVTADASAGDTRAALSSLQSMAAQYAVPMAQVTDGMESLVASGRDLQSALAFLPSILATAQASGAEVRDVATSADAMATSFGIGADQMTRAFDVLTKLGKEGKFEVRDMAAELPSLAPAFAALGYTGVDALTKLSAAAQTVRMQTGSSAEAATALMNVFQKMEASATAANFAKFGIDLRKEMQAAREEGRDLLEFYVDLSQRALKGDMSKLPQLFTDMQMLQGMRALISGADAMERFVKAANSADGTVLRDLNTVLQDTQSKVDKLSNAWGRLWAAAGAGLVDMGAGSVMDAASERIQREAAITQAHRKAGRGFWDATIWNTGASDQDMAGLAWQGGYRSPADRASIAAYGAMAAGRGEAAPSTGALPIPTARPQRGGRRGGGPFAGNRVEIIERQAVPMTREEKRAARIEKMDSLGWANEADKAAQAITAGGQQAGESLKAGGGEAGQHIEEAADAIRRAGADAAAAIAGAANGIASRISSAVRGAAIRADVGRSGPAVEGGGRR